MEINIHNYLQISNYYFTLISSIRLQKKKNHVGQKSLRHQVFPGGPPSKYYPGPTMLNFRDQTRTGVFIVVWSQAIDIEIEGQSCLYFSYSTALFFLGPSPQISEISQIPTTIFALPKPPHPSQSPCFYCILVNRFKNVCGRKNKNHKK